MERVGPVGIEPTTHGLKVRCSNKLSYSASRPLLGSLNLAAHLFEGPKLESYWSLSRSDAG